MSPKPSPVLAQNAPNSWPASRPPPPSRCTGSIETKKFGAAGLAKAFDLARQLAVELCTALPAEPQAAIYEPAATQGILAARLVDEAIERLNRTTWRSRTRNYSRSSRRTRRRTRSSAPSPSALLTVIPATLKAAPTWLALQDRCRRRRPRLWRRRPRPVRDLPGARGCPDKIAGLGSGYLGELDKARYDELLARVRRWRRSAASSPTGSPSCSGWPMRPRATRRSALAAVATGAGRFAEDRRQLHRFAQGGRSGRQESAVQCGALPGLCGAHRGDAGAGCRPAAGGDDDREGQSVHRAEAAAVGGGVSLVSAA
jgi:hypothetical protein